MTLAHHVRGRSSCSPYSSSRRHRRRRRGERASRAFTLIEVLATLVLLGIVIPAAMWGISVSLSASSSARRTAEAAVLAEAKLNEMVSSGEWSTGLTSGDFGADWPGYRWTSEGAGLDYELTELQVTVTWVERGAERSFRIATLVHSGVVTGTSSGTTGGIQPGVLP